MFKRTQWTTARKHTEWDKALKVKGGWVDSVVHSPLFPMGVAMAFVIFVGLSIGAVEHTF